MKMDDVCNMLEDEQINELIILAAFLKRKRLIDATNDPAKFCTTNDTTNVTNKILVLPDDAPNGTTKETKHICEEDEKHAIIENIVTTAAAQGIRAGKQDQMEKFNIRQCHVVLNRVSEQQTEKKDSVLQEKYRINEKMDSINQTTQEVCADKQNWLQNFKTCHVVVKRLPKEQIQHHLHRILPSLNTDGIKESNYQCYDCDKFYTTKNDLKKHVLECYRKKFHVCGKCKKPFFTNSDLERHLASHVNEKRPCHKCNICNKLYSTKSILRKHLYIHTNKRPYACQFCMASFNNSGTRRRHVLRHKNGAIKTLRVRSNKKTEKLRTHKCDICEKSFYDKRTLKKHSLIHTADKCSYSCDMCHKSFRCESQLQRHICDPVHRRCNICNKSLSSKDALKRHFVVHTGQKPHKCDLCNKSFTHASNLNRHRLIIHSGKAKHHRCNICEKVFTQKSTLNAHQLTHSYVKSYKCRICELTFDKDEDLTKHFSQAHGIVRRPYTCEICGKSVTQKGSLKTHMLTHTFEKRHECEICQKAFAQKSALNLHLTSHRDERPYSCLGCEKLFKSKQGMRMHYLHTHFRKDIT